MSISFIQNSKIFSIKWTIFVCIFWLKNRRKYLHSIHTWMMRGTHASSMKREFPYYPIISFPIYYCRKRTSNSNQKVKIYLLLIFFNGEKLMILKIIKWIIHNCCIFHEWEIKLNVKFSSYLFTNIILYITRIKTSRRKLTSYIFSNDRYR